MRWLNDWNLMQRAGLCIRVAKMIQICLLLHRKMTVHNEIIHDLVINISMFGGSPEFQNPGHTHVWQDKWAPPSRLNKMAKGERAQVSFGQTVKDLRPTGVEWGRRESHLIWASGHHCDTVTGGSQGEVVRRQSLEKWVGISRNGREHK